jgi:hypothetical protein
MANSITVGDHVRITSIPGKPLGRITRSVERTADEKGGHPRDPYVYDVWVEAQQKEYRGLRASDLAKPRAD